VVRSYVHCASEKPTRYGVPCGVSTPIGWPIPTEMQCDFNIGFLFAGRVDGLPGGEQYSQKARALSTVVLSTTLLFQSKSMRAEDLPTYKNIPAVPGMPHGCAWGLYDKNGEKDQLGALNLLTPEVVQEAGKEIKTGDRCVLKYFGLSSTRLILV
jgi:hypothetical protein